MFDVKGIVQLHDRMVKRWHACDVDNPYAGALATICGQHGYNFQLWHQEDIARSPQASDTQIAEVKRSIDRLNQLRNDWVERIDDGITEALRDYGVTPFADAGQNTESPASAIDRLSILSLRIYHLEEQATRRDTSLDHQQECLEKLEICREQRADLATSLETLLGQLLRGEKRHKTYRQLKLYNDPRYNPYLYKTSERVVASSPSDLVPRIALQETL